MTNRTAERRFYLFLYQRYLRLIRWAFERLYREFAWTYDAVAWVVSRGLWRTWVYTALPHLRGRVLELGCGPGHLQRARIAADPDALTVGLDRSPFMLAQSAGRMRRAGLAPQLLQAAGQHLPLASACFDTIVATFPAEYIRDPRTHAEIQRVLSSDGQLVLVLGAEFLHNGLLERLIDLAFRLTLQRSTRPSADHAPQPLQIDGMHVEHMWVKVGASRALILIATKAAPL